MLQIWRIWNVNLKIALEQTTWTRWGPRDTIRQGGPLKCLDNPNYENYPTEASKKSAQGRSILFHKIWRHNNWYIFAINCEARASVYSLAVCFSIAWWSRRSTQRILNSACFQLSCICCHYVIDSWSSQTAFAMFAEKSAVISVLSYCGHDVAVFPVTFTPCRSKSEPWDPHTSHLMAVAHCANSDPNIVQPQGPRPKCDIAEAPVQPSLLCNM